LNVNAGRAPTRIGGDGIDPYLDVPHWLSVDLKRLLRSHRVEHAVVDGYMQRVDSDDPDDHRDRFSFPGSDPTMIQAIVNTLPCD
jgi:hypothetical protein